MEERVEVTININKLCSRCKKPGATPCGLCLTCATEPAIMQRLLKGVGAMDAVLLVDQKDPGRLYQQAKAVEAQRALNDLRTMTEDDDDETMKAVRAALDRVNMLVGLLLSSRLVVRKPVQPPQTELEFADGKSALPREA